jgi:CRISPR-associated endoribonuclease Cas6
VTFDLLSCRFQMSARKIIRFPPGQAGNVLRGALGAMLREIASPEDYARIFAPVSTRAGPSGLADRPRPFVIRAASLNGQTLEPGDPFSFGLNLFDTADLTLEYFTRALAQWAGLGSMERRPVEVDLRPKTIWVSRIRVEFQTPCELKSSDGDVGDFAVLLARARDRVSTLRSLYGAGPLEIDFRALTERARSVKTVRRQLTRVGVERRSSRTGQRHGIGGFTGSAEYEGDLPEFLPYLEAARWTGVGRHCTWGNGQIHVEVIHE